MHPKPLITVKEARKLLGVGHQELTNQEILNLLLDSEQVIRLLVRQYLVRKSEVV